MLLPSLAILVGLGLLVWAVDHLVEGASATAWHFSVSPLLVGMLIVGFGNSAPELVVSALAASQNAPGLALGTAWGANIVNLALILGVTSLVSPVIVHSRTLRRELPLLMAATGLSIALAWDLQISQVDGAMLLLVFVALVVWSIRQGRQGGGDALAQDTATEMRAHAMPLKRALMGLTLGLLVLFGSSHLLVWGAVAMAQLLGVSELAMGLTVVAVGTSLPELISCVVAARKGEHGIALGNVLGANLFNSLAVVGLAGAMGPIGVDYDVISRDAPVMGGLTLALFTMGWGFRGRPGRINRLAAAVLVATYLGYIGWLMSTLAPPT